MIQDSNRNYGLLITKDALLYRKWFNECVKLLGIYCLYQAPRASKSYDLHGELDTKYYEPIKVGVLFDSHPDIKTLKKHGWVTELQADSVLIHVPYDLEHLEVGALFTIPDGIREGTGRKFRVISMQTTMIYPASITCELAPEYDTTEPISELYDYTKTTNNTLLDNEGDD